MKGFVFIELLVVVFIIALLASGILAGFRFFQNKMGLEEAGEQIINILRLAQNKTLASEGKLSYGVHFENSRFILFAGSSYQEGLSSNKQYNLSGSLEIASTSLAGGGTNVIFNRLTGRTEQFGSINLRIKSDPLREKIIYISSTGQISSLVQAAPLETRIEDSRHVHLSYGRAIDTNAEKIILSFSNPPNSPVIQEIIIKDNLDANGQFNWVGAITVGGNNQQIEIRTHQLNNPTTIFSITRDRRYNDKALSFSISGEIGYNLVDYTAAGLVAIGSSLWASGLEEQ